MTVLVYNFNKLDCLSNTPDMRNFNKTKLLSLCGNVLPLILVVLLTLPDFSFLSYKGNSLPNIASSTLNSSIDELSSHQDLYVQDGDEHYIDLSESRIIETISSKFRYFQSNSELRAHFICSHRHSRSPPII